MRDHDNMCLHYRRHWEGYRRVPAKKSVHNIDNAQKHSTEYGETIREYLWTGYLSRPCISCGETDPVVLEFQHIHSKDIGYSKWSQGLQALKDLRKSYKRLKSFATESLLHKKGDGLEAGNRKCTQRGSNSQPSVPKTDALSNWAMGANQILPGCNYSLFQDSRRIVQG